MEKFGIGQPVRRVEDPRLLTGRGRFVDDIDLPRQCRGVVLYSPHAHARIRSIDAEAARRAPGVLLVLTGADVEQVHARGRDQRRREEGGTGIVEEEISTDLLYDHASVLAVADWKAAAYAEVPRRWLVNGPEASDLADYDLGDPIAVNDSKLGLSIAVGTEIGRAHV